MGTALYVSPEQATGATVTGASDIYSLGVVAFECLAGQPPFIAEQPLAIAIMHKHDPVPPLPPDVPRPVADLVFAMLAKDPADRPDSARHVADRAQVIMDARDDAHQRPDHRGPADSARLSDGAGHCFRLFGTGPWFPPREPAPRGGGSGGGPVRRRRGRRGSC